MNIKNTVQLIVGLGNPGDDYADTYHNIGAGFIETLRDTHRFSPYAKTKKITLYRSPKQFWGIPLCYMNNSGEAVSEALDTLNISPDKLLVIHDDSDLPIGVYRLAFARGAAGHHGVESIFAHLKTHDFWRLRIGIRPTLRGKLSAQKAEEFVLKKISAKNKKVFYGILNELEASIKLMENATEPSG